jgi:hypothetical protein
MKRLEAIMAGHTSAADVVQEEKWVGSSVPDAAFSPCPTHSGNWPELWDSGPGWRSTPAILVSQEATDLRQLFEVYGRSHRQRKASVSSTATTPSNLEDPISRIFLPGFYNTDWTFASNQTQSGLLLWLGTTSLPTGTRQVSGCTVAVVTTILESRSTRSVGT